MDTSLRDIREQQKASWNKFSAGWRKWDADTMAFLQPMGDEMIRLLHRPDNELLLDIAAGTGEPGLTLAAMMPNGKVVLTDLSEDMLAVAREKAEARNIANVDMIIADVSELPFADHTFDALSCRFGFMFFPDMLQAAKQMYRVLKPGGRMATAVWNGPEKNFWVTAMGATINKHLHLPPPPPGAVGMFRCANPDTMKQLLAQAGFTNITAREVTSRSTHGTAQVYWDMMTEVAAPFAAALGQADEAMRATIKAEVFDLVHQKFPPDQVFFDASATVLYAEK